MKKTIHIIIFLFIVFFLSSCDNPEKSFQALQRHKIPKEVTRNFQLERGVYAPFVWTSDNDAIVISRNEAIVNQKSKDVMVLLTATINKKSETFEIKVLKADSPLTSREQSEDIAIYLNETYTQIDGGLLEIPNEINGIYIKYHLDLLQASYGYKVDEEKTYLSSSFRASGESISIPMSFYDDIDMSVGSEVYSAYLALIAKPLVEDDLFLLALQEINIKNYQFTNNLRYTIGISNLNIGDIIEFQTSQSFDVNLQLNRNEYFIKIDSNKYEIIKDFRDGILEIGRLTITIDGLSKTIYLHMYM